MHFPFAIRGPVRAQRRGAGLCSSCIAQAQFASRSDFGEVVRRLWGYNGRASRKGAPLSGGEASTVCFACIRKTRHNCIGVTALFSNAHNSGIRRLIFRVPLW